MAAERAAYQRAATLFGCAQRLRAALLASGALGEAAFAAAVDRGRTMAIDETGSYMLDEKRSTPRPQAATGPSGVSLTRRELEIARLIAEGVTSQQIAARLFISERTVTTHVTNMLNKLGLSSRIQLARWVAGDEKPAQAPTT